MKFQYALTLCLSALISSASYASYLQEDSAQYVADFAELYAKSYTMVDNQAPSNLISQCKNQAPSSSTQVVVQSDNATISAADVQSQCGATNACIVEGDLTVEMDASLKVHSLIVRNGATIKWDDTTQSSAEQWICAGYVVVEEDGAWEMNLQDAEKRAWIYIMNNSAVHDGLRTRAFGSYVEMVDHSGHVMPESTEPEPLPKLSVVGREMARTWSLLAEPLNVDDTTIQLMHDPIEMGWQINDRIAIAPTADRMKEDAQHFFIQAMTKDGKVTLNQASTGYHEAEAIHTTTGVAALRSAEVINLSRNIIITGDDFEELACDASLTEAYPGFGTSTEGCMCGNNRTSCTMGLHTGSAHGGYTEVANVRVEKCGQRGVEGKYCLHFHHMMDCKNTANPTHGSNCVYRNNAVEASQQRGLIVHSTHNAIVDSNVFNDVRGASIYIEDGNEILNKITYNVGICPWGDNGCTVPGTSNNQGDTALNQTGLYTETPNNHFIGNRMANHFNGQFNNPGSGRGPVSQEVCARNLPLGIWDGNTFHSNGRFGSYLLNSNFPVQETGQTADNNGTTGVANCERYANDGSDFGLPAIILNHFDYGNDFVGQYEAGDIQYNKHVSISNLNSIYWKEVKSTQDGCSAQMSDSYYKDGHLALPDATGSFIIENTALDHVDMGANHHCNVGVTGFLCMPHYVFDNVTLINGKNKWVDFDLNNESTNLGGIFSLSPPDMEKNIEGSDNNFILPAGYKSLVSTAYPYLTELNQGCVAASDIELGDRYENGILCPVPLEALKIYARDLAEGTNNHLVLEVLDANTGALITRQEVPHIHSANSKQGYSVPVVPGNDFKYNVKLLDGSDIPSDWIIDFGDIVTSNRWGVKQLNIDVQGRECNGTIYSNHDRKYYAAGNFSDNQFNGWGRGACTEYPEMEATNCSVLPDLVEETKDRNYDWESDIGKTCTTDCGENGSCSASYLGSDMPVLDAYMCVCESGFSGANCDGSPIVSILDLDPDSDADGVIDSIDECNDTEAGKEVNEKGCDVVVTLEDLRVGLMNYLLLLILLMIVTVSYYRKKSRKMD